MVHATGRAVAARVPGDPRRGFDPRRDQAAGARRRDHPAAGPPLRRRRGGAVQRHRRAGPRRRFRHRRRPRARARSPNDRCGPVPTSNACARSRSTTSSYVVDTVRLLADELPAVGAAARLRRRAVHGRQLSHRGSAEQGLPPHQGADPHRRGALARDHGAARRVGDHLHRCPAEQRRGRVPAVRLLGGVAEPARLRPVRAAPFAPRVRRAAAAASRRREHPLRHRLRPPPRIDARRRSRPCSVSIGAPGSPTPGAGSATISSSRATSTLHSCWPEPRRRWPAPDRSSTTTRTTTGGSRPRTSRHIFNLGHGVPPEADPAVLQDVVDFVHEQTSTTRT